jgi:aminoglycoside N3'-acetyltransferase
MNIFFKRVSGRIDKGLTRLIKLCRKIKRPQTKSRLLNNLRESGLGYGDTLLVHSSLSKIGNVEGGSSTIIDALIDCVGDQGNIIMPTYSYVNSMANTTREENYIFDPEKSKSVVGIVTETFRNMKNVRRSIHPTHSICAFGPNSETIVSGHLTAETNFGVGTPFHKVREMKGKIVGIGIGIGPVTIYHTIEDFFPNDFKGVYLEEKYPIKIKLDNKVFFKNIFIHNPEFHKNRIDKTPEIEHWFRRYFKEKNILHEGTFGSGNIWWMDIQNLYDELVELRKKGITIYNTPKN